MLNSARSSYLANGLTPNVTTHELYNRGKQAKYLHAFHTLPLKAYDNCGSNGGMEDYRVSSTMPRSSMANFKPYYSFTLHCALVSHIRNETIFSDGRDLLSGSITLWMVSTYGMTPVRNPTLLLIESSSFIFCSQLTAYFRTPYTAKPRNAYTEICKLNSSSFTRVAADAHLVQLLGQGG